MEICQAKEPREDTIEAVLNYGHTVIPVLIGPLQVLMAILPMILLSLGGLIVAAISAK